jgi:hypothetical protein
MKPLITAQVVMPKMIFFKNGTLFSTHFLTFNKLVKLPSVRFPIFKM